MDLYCPKCGEPWENDTLHDEAKASGQTYRAIGRDFQSRGCEALTSYGAKHTDPPIETTDRTWGLKPQEAAALMYDLLGDDLDGAAAMLDDLGY